MIHNNVESMMKINHLTNFYHAYAYHCLKSSLLHFSCFSPKILLCFFSAQGLLEKKIVFAKWDKYMERSSLVVNLFFQETCQFQQHELDLSLQQVG